jgi:phosphotriesterase-related protein
LYFSYISSTRQFALSHYKEFLMNMKSTKNNPDVTPKPVGKNSGEVMTVLGPIPVEKLGITLMHEHLLGDASSLWVPPEEPKLREFAFKPVSLGIRADLQLYPWANRDNTIFNDFETAVEEVSKFREHGGSTVVECTTEGIGRDPRGLVNIAKRTGLNVIMGAGYYTDDTHPARLRKMSASDIADEIVRDLLEGIPGIGVRAGVIGEIGMDWEFTEEEQKSLRGAAQASVRTGVPIIIHLEGWHRWGHQSLDIVEEEGASLDHTVVSHMVASIDDWEYQTSLADRGAYLGYDMIGQDVNWGADLHHGECPSDREVALAIKRLIDAGYLRRITLSHDICAKLMLTRYGGKGYAFILRHFVDRLKRIGVTEEQIETLLVENPRTFFSTQ